MEQYLDRVVKYNWEGGEKNAGRREAEDIEEP